VGDIQSSTRPPFYFYYELGPPINNSLSKHSPHAIMVGKFPNATLVRLDEKDMKHVQV